MAIVRIPTPLRASFGGNAQVEAAGDPAIAGGGR